MEYSPPRLQWKRTWCAHLALRWGGGVLWFSTPLSSSLVFSSVPPPSAWGYRRIPQLKGLVLQNCPHFACQSQAKVPCASESLAGIRGLHGPPSGSLIFARDPDRAQKAPSCLPGLLQRILKDMSEQPEEETPRVRAGRAPSTGAGFM